MWKAIADFLTHLLTGLALVMFGAEREKRWQREADIDLLKKYQGVDHKPDVPRPFGGMRDEK